MQGQRAMGRVAGQVEDWPCPSLPHAAVVLPRHPARHVRRCPPVWLPWCWLNLVGAVLVSTPEKVQEVLIPSCFCL